MSKQRSSKFFIYLMASRYAPFRWLIGKSLGRAFDAALTADADATLHLLISQLCSSNNPKWTWLILALLEAVPGRLLDESRVVRDYFECLPGTSVRRQLVVVRAVLTKCFYAGALDVSEERLGVTGNRGNGSSYGGQGGVPSHLQMLDLCDQHESATLDWISRHVGSPDQALQDPVTLVKKVTEAATHGDSEAQYILGLSYSDGFGVGADSVAALNWLRRAAESQNASAQCTLGYMYWLGYAAPQDRAEGVRWLRAAASRGNKRARLALKLVDAPE